jgi:hypothetical protein
VLYSEVCLACNEGLVYYSCDNERAFGHSSETEFYPIVSEENGSSFLLPARKKKKVVSEGEGVKSIMPE